MTQLLNPTLIRSRTAELRQQFEPAVNGARATAAEKKAYAIGEAIAKGDFGCRRESVRQLVEAVTGLTIVLPASDGGTLHRTHVIGSLIVFKGDTFIVTGVDSDLDGYIIDADLKDQTKEASSYVQRSDEFRPATEEEIVTFLSHLGIPDNTADAHA